MKPQWAGGFRIVMEWLGFASPKRFALGSGHGHAHGSRQSHSHGVVDASITTSARGIWAIKWSFVILGITALLQMAVVIFTGSVALLADTIHNIGDAATAIPLWIAFAFARRKPSNRFTYGFGRVEDLAGIAVVLIILASAIVAAYEAIDRIVHPRTIDFLPWVAVAGVVGFIGNEVVAIFRIRVGREINSAALIADGYHARTDGLTSLAVVAGAIGVAFGFHLADPIVGLLITIAIFGIVWQAAKAVFLRVLDGVEPEVVEEIHHSATHVLEVHRVINVRARWIGHRLSAELDVSTDTDRSLQDADRVAEHLERVLLEHLPALQWVRVRVRPSDSAERQADKLHSVTLWGTLATGRIELVDTPAGERFRLSVSNAPAEMEATVSISRPGGSEIVPLVARDEGCFESRDAPAEPHEFQAELHLKVGNRTEVLHFAMSEPHGHVH